MTIRRHAEPADDDLLKVRHRRASTPFDIVVRSHEMHETSADLKIAREAIERMADTESFAEFHRHWQDFLFRIERAWEGMLGRIKSHRGGTAQSWISANSALRKKDSLLRYLKHARDAETHVLGETVENVLELSFEDKFRRRFRVNSVSTHIEGTTLVVDIDSPDEHLEWQGSVKPGDPRMLRFKSRGVWYNPPTEHLGNRLENVHPVAVALLGYEFYRAAETLARTEDAR